MKESQMLQELQSSIVLLLMGLPFIAFYIALRIRGSNTKELKLLATSALLSALPFMCLAFLRFGHNVLDYDPGGPMLFVAMATPLVLIVSFFMAVFSWAQNLDSSQNKWAILLVVINLIYIGLAILAWSHAEM